jgi:phosphate-selective porin OprO/OprP
MSSTTLARRARGLAVAFIAAVAAVRAGTASAGAAEATAEKPVVEKLLDIMLQQHSITPAQYDELLAQAKREQVAAVERAAEAASAAETAPAAPSPEDWHFAWNNGFGLERADGAYKLRLGGRIQVDGAVVSESDGLNEDLRALGGDGQGNGVEFRRARFFVDATVYERLLFKAQYDFAGGQAAFKDVYVGLKGLGPVGTVLVGQMKEPFVLDEQASSNNITFMERAPNSAFYPDRNVGLMALNNELDKRMFWQAGIFRDSDDFGDAFSSSGRTDWDLGGRVTGLPVWSDDGSRFVHLGAGYLHRFRGDTIRFRARPDSRLADFFADTRSDFDDDLDLNAAGADLVDLEFVWVHGPVSVLSEYTHAFVDGDDGQSNVDFLAANAQLSYFLTGEHKAYEPEWGRLGRVRPKQNFDPAHGHWGAWEIAARFDYLDLDDRDVHGGRLWDVTAGLNWYLFPNARIMFNYVHADLSKREAIVDASTLHVSGSADIAQTRLMVDF